MKWDSGKFASAIRHIPGNRGYNPNMRQLLHVSFKLAAMRMDEYNALLEKYRGIVSECVYENIYNRHICRLFEICESMVNSD
jgi:tagaturonate epimerase